MLYEIKSEVKRVGETRNKKKNYLLLINYGK